MRRERVEVRTDGTTKPMRQKESNLDRRGLKECRKTGKIQ
jgi:hypothetical protein